MGLDSFWRNLNRRLAKRAFHPHPGPKWPNVSARPIRSFISDANSLIRGWGLQISGNGLVLDYGIRTWGDFLDKLARTYAKLFAEGVRYLRVVFDGKTPPNKGVEQGSRKEAWQASFVEGAKPYQWPKEDDGTNWFPKEKQVFCSLNDIYYGGPLAKRKWYEFITHYLLYEMPLPPDCEILVDCGALPGIGALRRPVRAYLDHGYGPNANVEDLRMFVAVAEQEMPGDHIIKRVIEDVPGEEPYNTFTEADDRCIKWLFYDSLNEEEPKDVMLGTEDGDLELAAIASYHTRRMLRPDGKPPGRVFIRRSQVIAWAVNDKGVKSKVVQPEWIDTDLLGEFLDQMYLGILADRMQHPETDLEHIGRCEPLVFYCMITLMCKNDYAEGFRGLSAVNILRGAMSRPDLARQVLHVQKAPRHGKRALEAARAPDTLLISAADMRRFVAHCYSIAYQNRLSPKTYPVPPDHTIDAITARISWVLDKIWNAGRPGYIIANPFRMTEDTNESIYGHAMVPDEEDPRRKKPKFAERVDRRAFYGVTHEPAVNGDRRNDNPSSSPANGAVHHL